VISTPQGYAVDYNQLPVDMEVIAWTHITNKR
jgi:hypothetical protein